MSRLSVSPPPFHALAVLAACFRISVPPSLGFREPLARDLGGGVDRGVLSLRQGYEVRRVVVRRVAVYVMDVYSRRQSTVVGFLPFQAMLRDISSVVRKVVARHEDEDVPAVVDLSPALPSIGSLARLIVAVDIAQRVTPVLVAAQSGLFRYRRLFAATTLTFARWPNPIWRRLYHQVFSASTELVCSLVMAGQIARRSVTVMRAVGDFGLAPALA
jgi:hypothetical protein